MNTWTISKRFLKMNYQISVIILVFYKMHVSAKKTINVWNVFKMNTMGNYHVLYLKKDVLFLAEVFEKLINKCLEYYGLDPCHYFSCLVLSWDAMLEMTEVELQPI